MRVRVPRPVCVLTSSSQRVVRGHEGNQKKN